MQQLSGKTGNAALPDDAAPPEEALSGPPYEPPAIVYQAPLETTAAFCDPLAGGKTADGYCSGLGPINS